MRYHLRARPRTGGAALARAEIPAAGRGAFADPSVDIAHVEQRDAGLAHARPAWSCSRSGGLAGLPARSGRRRARVIGTLCRGRNAPAGSIVPAMQHLDLLIAEHGEQEIAVAADWPEAGIHRSARRQQRLPCPTDRRSQRRRRTWSSARAMPSWRVEVAECRKISCTRTGIGEVPRAVGF